MALGTRREKDQRMAQMLKKLGVRRDTGRCPVCYKIVKNGTHPGVGCYSKN
jgi:hypothetical protein